jgi:hypothetical protein
VHPIDLARLGSHPAAWPAARVVIPHYPHHVTAITYGYDLAGHPLGFADNSASIVVPSTVGAIATDHKHV